MLSTDPCGFCPFPVPPALCLCLQTKHGVDLSKYTHRIAIIPYKYCGWVGKGTQGTFRGVGYVWAMVSGAGPFYPAAFLACQTFAPHHGKRQAIAIHLV